MTPKEHAYVKARLENPEGTKSAAVAKAGYAQSTQAAQIEESKAVKNELIKAYAAKGLDVQSLADKGKELLNAKKTSFYSYRGKVIDQRESEDSDIQLGTLKLLSEQFGYTRNNNIENLNIGIIQIPQGSEDMDQWGKDYGVVGEVLKTRERKPIEVVKPIGSESDIDKESQGTGGVDSSDVAPNPETPYP